MATLHSFAAAATARQRSVAQRAARHQLGYCVDVSPMLSSYAVGGSPAPAPTVSVVRAALGPKVVASVGLRPFCHKVGVPVAPVDHPAQHEQQLRRRL
jgi:hypothetical protein